MKLLNYTSKYLALLLLLLISIWAVLFYYAMLDEIYDSLDDGLENQKFLMVERAAEDPSILSQNDPEFKKHIYNFTPISHENYQNFKESYRDTLMYMLNEKDYEPVRVYESAAVYGDKYYKLKIITSMVEEDDLVQHLAAYLIGLYLILLVSILFLNNLLLKRIWKPFYSLIDQLRKFKIEKGIPIVTQESPIEEFNLLNKTVEKLTQKSTDSYIAQKQFIENASHELQTPLAISINKLELLLENTDLTKNHSEDLTTILDNLGRLTRMNRSLVLLSKIENKQFELEEEVDFAILTKHIVADFEDLAEHRNMKIKIISNHFLKYQINEDLAIVLLLNLVKNALVHGEKGSKIKIDIQPNSLQISNFGDPESIDKASIFQRFATASNSKKSTGLGLAIAKAIANRYSINLSYNFNETHNFLLEFPYED